mmetsp:Transcript_36014/g.113150  ORF Transcript_36014/g.113150 Transcript_36014/m.113150 type:complete len:726 (-) Transcript_36014:117-2294(-)
MPLTPIEVRAQTARRAVTARREAQGRSIKRALGGGATAPASSPSLPRSKHDSLRVYEQRVAPPLRKPKTPPPRRKKPEEPARRQIVLDKWQEELTRDLQQTMQGIASKRIPSRLDSRPPPEAYLYKDEQDLIDEQRERLMLEQDEKNREEDQRRVDTKAQIFVSRCWRGYRVRRIYLPRLRERMRFRRELFGMYAEEKFERRRLRAERRWKVNLMVAKVQAVARAYVMKRKYQRVQGQRYKRCATKILKSYRRLRAWRKISTRRFTWQTVAATTIQAGVRRYFARCEYRRRMNRRIDAKIIIHRSFKRYHERRFGHCARNICIPMQRRWRRRIAANKIQRMVRGFLSRRKFRRIVRDAVRQQHVMRQVYFDQSILAANVARHVASQEVREYYRDHTPRAKFLNLFRRAKFLKLFRKPKSGASIAPADAEDNGSLVSASSSKRTIIPPEIVAALKGTMDAEHALRVGEEVKEERKRIKVGVWQSRGYAFHRLPLPVVKLMIRAQRRDISVDGDGGAAHLNTQPGEIRDILDTTTGWISLTVPETQSLLDYCRSRLDITLEDVEPFIYREFLHLGSLANYVKARLEEKEAAHQAGAKEALERLRGLSKVLKVLRERQRSASRKFWFAKDKASAHLFCIRKAIKVNKYAKLNYVDEKITKAYFETFEAAEKKADVRIMNKCTCCHQSFPMYKKYWQHTQRLCCRRVPPFCFGKLYLPEEVDMAEDESL